jgi:hypothetical protein
MTRRRTNTRLALLAAVALLWAGWACNSIGDHPELAEAVVLVTDVDVSPVSQAALGDTVATLSLKIADRTGLASSFYNDVTFTNYTVAFTPAGLVPDIPNGAINSGFSGVGTSPSLLLPLCSQAARAGAPAGTLISGAIHVEGHDLRGRPLSFEHQVAFAFTP